MRRAGACVFSRKLFLARRGRSFMYRMRPVPSVRRRRAFSPQLSERGRMHARTQRSRWEEEGGRGSRQRVRENRTHAAIVQQSQQHPAESDREQQPTQSGAAAANSSQQWEQRVVRRSSVSSVARDAPRAGEANTEQSKANRWRRPSALRPPPAPCHSFAAIRRLPAVICIAADIGASSWPGRRSSSSGPKQTEWRCNGQTQTVSRCRDNWAGSCCCRCRCRRCRLVYLLDVEAAASAAHAQSVRVLVAATEREGSLSLMEDNNQPTQPFTQQHEQASATARRRGNMTRLHARTPSSHAPRSLPHARTMFVCCVVCWMR